MAKYAPRAALHYGEIASPLRKMKTLTKPECADEPQASQLDLGCHWAALLHQGEAQ